MSYKIYTATGIAYLVGVTNIALSLESLNGQFFAPVTIREIIRQSF